MRKFLLSSAALLGATTGMASLAVAQTLPPTISEGIVSKPEPVQAANNSNNYQPAFLPGGVPNPTPGTIVVHFNGRVLSYFYDEASSFDKSPNLGPNTGTPAKVQNYGILNYMRLFAGVDGLATNGLKYGASIEIRANVGPTNGSSANSGSSANTFSNTLYVRRQFVYFGSTTTGLFRFGQADGVTGIFDNGITTFQNFDNGAWNGDLPGVVPGNAEPAFPFFSQQGAEYGSAKLVYLSPQFAGFDIGLHYAPSSAVGQNGYNTVSLTQATNANLNAQQCSIAAQGCANLGSSGNVNDGARFKNQYVGGIRYQNKFGDLAAYGYAAYVGSGHVNYTGTSAFQQYDGLSVGDFGAALTYAGVTVGGHYTYGNFNGAEALKPRGGKKGDVWLVGAQYAVGPFTIGASYYRFFSQGSPNLVGISHRAETGLAAGLTYGIAPGISLFASYLYGDRRQRDFNFQTGVAGTSADPQLFHNTAHDQVGAIGTIVKW